jgi:hypothetical protein
MIVDGKVRTVARCPAKRQSTDVEAILSARGEACRHRSRISNRHSTTSPASARTSPFCSSTSTSPRRSVPSSTGIRRPSRRSSRSPPRITHTTRQRIASSSAFRRYVHITHHAPHVARLLTVISVRRSTAVWRVTRASTSHPRIPSSRHPLHDLCQSQLFDPTATTPHIRTAQQ